MPEQNNDQVKVNLHNESLHADGLFTASASVCISGPIIDAENIAVAANKAMDILLKEMNK